MKRILFALLIAALTLLLCGCGSEIVGSWELSEVRMRAYGSEGLHEESTEPEENGTVIMYTFDKDGSYTASARADGAWTRTEVGTYSIHDNYLSIETPESSVRSIWRIEGDELMLIMGEARDNATMYFEKKD